MFMHQALFFRLLSLFVEQIPKLQTARKKLEHVRKRA
jgi:hypothetical protein